LNPRDPFESNGFQDRRIQPLCHSSAVILLHLWKPALHIHLAPIDIRHAKGIHLPDRRRLACPLPWTVSRSRARWPSTTTNIARRVVIGQYIVHNTAILDAGQSLDVDGRSLQCRKWREGLVKRPARKASMFECRPQTVFGVPNKGI
jgi:hypothetical protein